MTQYQTPTYQITYADDLEPLANYPALTQAVAQTVDAALLRGGVAPPTAASLAAEIGARQALDARVAAVERRAAARVTVTGTSQSIASATPTVLPFAARTAKSLASMWSATNPTRLVAPYDGEYDLTVMIAWAGNSTGQRSLSYKLNGASYYFATMNAPTAPYGGEASAVARGIVLLAGQYVEFQAQHTAGALLGTGPYSATLSAGLL